MSWRKFPISLSELCIDTTLRCGQSFRWKRSTEGDVYSCAFDGRLYSLRQDTTHLHYRILHAGQNIKNNVASSSAGSSSSGRLKRKAREEEEDPEAFLRHYLNLGPNLGALYEQWSTADKNFKKKAPRFTGVRILRQNAWEALVGFICSSNNNISRISQMMDKLCIHYGSLVGYIDGQAFYDMPPPSALTDSHVEGHLRELGFGYRARYLFQTAARISQEPEDWLSSLRNPESPLLGHEAADAGELLPGGREGYRHAHELLLELQGVGPKVADCVCLMGLGWGEAVPVDTHVWQIAQRDYHFGKGKHRSLTKATYDAVADHFRSLWGKEAGWAHSVLFTADLRAFSERLTAKLEIKEETKTEDVKDDVIKDEDHPDVRSIEAEVAVELQPALAPADDEEVKPLMKTERAVTFEARAEDEHAPLAETATTILNQQTQALKQESEPVESIENNTAVKQERNASVKCEAVPVGSARQTRALKSKSRTIKKESNSPAAMKTEKKEMPFRAENGEPNADASRPFQSETELEYAATGDDQQPALVASANSVVEEDAMPALDGKGQAKDEDAKKGTGSERPVRRASKRQKRR